MKLLALETSGTACSVALQCGDQIKVLHQIAPMQQARLILEMIQQLYHEFSLNTDQLDAIAYGGGPGSFTGIRIANMVAQGLAFAAQKPIIRLSSLAALAQTVYLEQQCKNVLVAVDARMEQIYWAPYKMGSHGRMILTGQESLCAAHEVVLPEDTWGWSAAGDGWEKYSPVIEQRLGFKPEPIYPALVPSAEALLPLARFEFEQGTWMTASEATPIYLR